MIQDTRGVMRMAVQQSEGAEAPQQVEQQHDRARAIRGWSGIADATAAWRSRCDRSSSREQQERDPRVVHLVDAAALAVDEPAALRRGTARRLRRRVRSAALVGQRPSEAREDSPCHVRTLTRREIGDRSQARDVHPWPRYPVLRDTADTSVRRRPGPTERRRGDASSELASRTTASVRSKPHRERDGIRQRRAPLDRRSSATTAGDEPPEQVDREIDPRSGSAAAAASRAARRRRAGSVSNRIGVRCRTRAAQRP